MYGKLVNYYTLFVVTDFILYVKIVARYYRNVAVYFFWNCSSQHQNNSKTTTFRTGGKVIFLLGMWLHVIDLSHSFLLFTVR